jgi:hypothetical protein
MARVAAPVDVAVDISPAKAGPVSASDRPSGAIA